MENGTHKHHITPLWIYLAVGGALLVLTIITVLAAQINFTAITGFAQMNFVIAMVIATIKATLVILFFMHLYYDNKFYLFTLISGVITLMIFITLTLMDVQYRGRVNSIEKGPIVEQTPAERFVRPSHPELHTETPTHH